MKCDSSLKGSISSVVKSGGSAHPPPIRDGGQKFNVRFDAWASFFLKIDPLTLLKNIGASPGRKLDSPGRRTLEMDRPVTFLFWCMTLTRRILG